MERIAETAGPLLFPAPCWCRKVRIRLKEGRPRPPAAGAWICCCRSGGSFLLWLSSRRMRLGRRSRHRQTGRGPRIRRGARGGRSGRRATIDAGRLREGLRTLRTDGLRRTATTPDLWKQRSPSRGINVMFSYRAI